jgi:ATP-dependent phosphofructokinase / diphosphate-dependent phosphofructokinase
MSQPRNLFYAQSGGVTAVINATAAGVIQTARANPDRIGTVFAGRNGIVGALREELIDTRFESDADIAALRHTPGGAFGSVRYKLKSVTESAAEYRRLIDVFRAHDIGYFVYNGGNDSMDTAHKVSEVARSLGYDLVAVGAPKTVDNDLPITDVCPGFGSVAKYVAISTLEAGFDVRSMFQTKVFIIEVMGRHAGWIAAAAGLAGADASEPPHLILFPEVSFDEDRFVAAVADRVERYGHCVVVASEGIRGADGRFVAESGTKDAFGHAQLGGVAQHLAEVVRGRLGLKFHYAVADYLQRAARHIASKVDVEQAYALGVAATQMAMDGAHGKMPVIKRLSDDPYRWEIAQADLAAVANVERHVPPEYITEDGYGITEAARRYLAPLIEGEDYPPYARGLPQYVILKRVLAPKHLAAWGG